MNEQGNKISVLDHGYVRLVESMGNDLSENKLGKLTEDELAWLRNQQLKG